MSLSNELISQFAKVIAEQPKTSQEATLYGTIVNDVLGNRGVCVAIDGSQEFTPVSYTSSAVQYKDGDRVIVRIKDHSVSIIGNVTSKPASVSEVTLMGTKITELEQLVSGSITTEQLAALVASVDRLHADNVTINGELDVAEGYIAELQADNVEIRERLVAHEVDISHLETEKLDAAVAEAEYAKIDDLDAVEADIYDLEVVHGEFQEATARNFEAVNASVNELDTKKLDAEQAELTYADIDFSNIGEAAIKRIFGETGIIKDLVVGDQTLTGELVGVTISGDLIKGNTVKADKLVVKGSDGLYYKLNIEAGVVASTEVSEEALQNGLHGSAIIAKTITAEKISVTDLVAFGATIGGYHITNNALYSGVKNSVDNTTPGVYLGSDGQMAIGDSSSFIRYYKDANGSYKLAIAADSIVFGSDIQFEGLKGVGVKATYRYYLRQDSNLEKPDKPTVYPPSAPWTDSESSAISPGLEADGDGNVTSSLILSDDGGGNVTATTEYNIGYTDSLYYVDCTVFSDDTFSYSEVSLSSSYEAAKTAYTKAFNAQDDASEAMTTSSVAESRVEILSESISMLVTDRNGASLMTQTETGWTFSTSEIQDLVDTTSERLNDLVNEVGDVESTVDILQQTLGDLGVITEYVKIGTYEDEPCIELGEGDSDFKLLITNTRIMFKEGTGVPAYFNNQSMYIKKAVIEEELQQGGFVWKVRSNGNMGLVWKGVTS